MTVTSTQSTVVRLGIGRAAGQAVAMFVGAVCFAFGWTVGVLCYLFMFLVLAARYGWRVGMRRESP